MTDNAKSSVIDMERNAHYYHYVYESDSFFGLCVFFATFFILRFSLCSIETKIKQFDKTNKGKKNNRKQQKNKVSIKFNQHAVDYVDMLDYVPHLLFEMF